MILEDFVSFEIAKLLKEKEFNEICSQYYSSDGRFNMGVYSNYNIDDERFSAPTIQMAMKWLREKHFLHCDIGYDDLDWSWNIISVSEIVPLEKRPKIIQDGFACFSCYEKACEKAIEYCLTNII